MGSAAIEDLVRTGKYGLDLGIGDLDLERAKVLANSFPNTSQTYKVNVTDVDKLASILKGYDAVVNATWYENNLDVMRACVKAGCNYNDLGGLFHTTRKQILLDTEMKASGISAVVGGGESPGITNVMCFLAAEEMSRVESVKIYAGAKETGSSDNLVFPFSVSTVIDEYTKKPVEYLEGSYREVPPLSGDEEIEFPEPIGKKLCHYSIHSEPATLPASIGKGVTNVEFRLGISEKLVSTLAPLIELGMLSEGRTIPVGGQLISPRDFVVSFFNAKSQGEGEIERCVGLKVVVTGMSDDGKKSKVTCDLICQPGSYGIKNATAYLTGVAGSIFGQYLANDKVPKGVIAPELAVDSKEFARELESRDIKIAKRIDFID